MRAHDAETDRGLWKGHPYDPGCSARKAASRDSCRRRHAVPVEVLSTHNNWLDFLAAFGGLAGMIGAIIALVFAKSSAAAAAGSLKLMQDEAQVAKEERGTD